MVRQLSFHRVKSGFISRHRRWNHFCSAEEPTTLSNSEKLYTEEFNQFGNVNLDFRRANTFSLHVAVLKGLPKNTKRKFVLVVE